MEFIGTAILEILKCVGPPVCKYVQYHRKLDENMENLRMKLQELNALKKDIEQKLMAQYDLGKEAENEVSNWLTVIQKINSEMEYIEKEVNKRRYLSRARLGKLVEEKIEKVKGYHQNGSSLASKVKDVPPPIGLDLPTDTLAGERNKEIEKKIWAHLISDKVTNIGVWGMAGVGKTAIMKHINNKLRKETNKFNHVLWVTVSQTFDLIKLQSNIAIALNQKQFFSQEEDKIKRAGRLLQILEGLGRFVLILDDMWEPFPLNEVGIPDPINDNRCKLVITTRSLDVCRFMKCEEVRVQPLTKEEAMDLFLDKVGLSISEFSTLEKIVDSVVKQCACLPHAIVTVADYMRGIDEIHEWRNALKELSGHVTSVRGMDTVVFGRLEFSYNLLKDKKVQHCFLDCALYPQDYLISKDELIGYWIAEGYCDEMDDVQNKYDRGHTILNRLVNCCLLESATNGRSVRMHDLIRDMALRITSKSPLFMVQAGTKLKEFPSEQKWKENLMKVSLMGNDISEIPLNMSPNCQTLSTLLLQNNFNLQRIPECFFVHMHGLMILNLSWTDIEALPNSVSDLINLRSLLLGYCQLLKRVPSLAKLSALQNLDLGETIIDRVPEGLELLENLNYIDLHSMKLEKLQAGIFRKLRRLFKLRVYWGSETLRETIEEAAKFSTQLDIFEGHFCKLDDFNICAKSLGSRGPKNYHLVLSLQPRRRGYFLSKRQDKMGYFLSKRPDQMGYFLSKRPDKMVSIFYESFPETEDRIVLPKDVQGLRMDSHIYLRSLKDIFSRDQGLICTYSSLKAIVIVSCHNLKKLLFAQLLSSLQNLELINLSSCIKIEEIIAVSVDEEAEEEEEIRKKESGINSIAFTLPRLRKLKLSYLPALKSICGDSGLMVCNSLEKIEINGCPKLKRLSLSLPLLDNGEPRTSSITALKAIKIEKEVWESLEWDQDQANAKNVLYPYCNFLPPEAK